MNGLKKIWGEFKKFITRGNVLDLAVGVVVGSAFTAIVTSLTNDIIMPLINSVVGDGGLSSLCTVLKGVYLEDGTLDLANSLVINWGNFIQAIFDFILIALVIFAIVKTINSLRDAGNKFNKQAKREKEIKKRAKKMAKEQGIAYADAKAKAEAQLLEEEKPAPAAPAKPTVEELLTDIKNLLAENAARSCANNSEGGTENTAEKK